MKSKITYRDVLSEIRDNPKSFIFVCASIGFIGMLFMHDLRTKQEIQRKEQKSKIKFYMDSKGVAHPHELNGPAVIDTGINMSQMLCAFLIFATAGALYQAVYIYRELKNKELETLRKNNLDALKGISQSLSELLQKIREAKETVGKKNSSSQKPEDLKSNSPA